MSDFEIDLTYDSDATEIIASDEDADEDEDVLEIENEDVRISSGNEGDEEGSESLTVDELVEDSSWSPNTQEIEELVEDDDARSGSLEFSDGLQEGDGNTTELEDDRSTDAGTPPPTASSSQQHLSSDSLSDVQSPEIRRTRRMANVIDDSEEQIDDAQLEEIIATAAAVEGTSGTRRERVEVPQAQPPTSPNDDPQPSTPPLPPRTSPPPQEPPSNNDSPAIEGTSGGASEGANVPVVVSVPDPPEESNPLGVPGPSTSTATSTTTPSKDTKHKDTAKGNDASPDCEEEGHICPICFEPCTNSGNHRIASLKCGHLFGFECIETWLQGTNKRNKGRCPHCNAVNSKKDIRFHYVKNIKVLDNSEKIRMQKELEREREEKHRLRLENAQLMLKEEMKSKMVVKLQEELKILKASVKSMGCAEPEMKPGKSSKRLLFKQWLEVCREGNCRVMAYNEWLGILVVSMPSQVDLFPGYGIKKINLVELNVERYLPLHQKQIRDLSFSPLKHDHLLSVGMDKLVKITNISSNTSVFQFTAPTSLWCCCWSTTDVNMFYVGTCLGRLLVFDSRHTAGPTATIEVPGSGPIVCMTYIHPGPKSSLTWGGILMNRLESCLFVDPGVSGEVKKHVLPLEGFVTSVSWDASSGHMLVSCRPSQKHPHARHIVCYLKEVRQTVTAHEVHTFRGGTTQKVLTRSLMAPPPHTQLSPLVYASDQSTQSVYVWEIKHMSCLQQLQLPNLVIDLLQVSVDSMPHLAALTEQGVRLYQWAD